MPRSRCVVYEKYTDRNAGISLHKTPILPSARAKWLRFRYGTMVNSKDSLLAINQFSRLLSTYNNFSVRLGNCFGKLAFYGAIENRNGKISV